MKAFEIPPCPDLCEACGKPATADTPCDVMGQRHSESLHVVVKRVVFAEREASAQAIGAWADSVGRGSHPITVEEAEAAVRERGDAAAQVPT